MNNQVFDLNKAIGALRTAATTFGGIGQSRKADTCSDIADKLDRFGSFASDRQRDFARSLVIEAVNIRRQQDGQPLPAGTSVAPAQPANPKMVPVGTFPKLAALFGVDKLAHINQLGRLHLKTDHEFQRIFIMVDDVCLAYMTPATGATYTTKRAKTANPADVAEMMGALTLIEADPLAAMAQYGKDTGRCCICSRHLTDETSIDLGIGPICRAKVGMAG